MTFKRPGCAGWKEGEERNRSRFLPEVSGDVPLPPSQPIRSALGLKAADRYLQSYRTGMPEKDQDDFVITKITQDSRGVGVGSAENRALRICGPVKAVLSPESKPKVKHNGEFEADRVCQ